MTTLVGFIVLAGTLAAIYLPWYLADRLDWPIIRGSFGHLIWPDHLKLVGMIAVNLATAVLGAYLFGVAFD